MNLAGAAAVITGGGSGLGAATAARLCRAGARVTILDIDEAAGSSMAQTLGEGARFVACDVADEAAVRRGIEAAGSDAPVRVVVSCAGIGLPRRLIGRDGQAHPLADFQRVLSVNLTGTFNVMRIGAEAMLSSPPGPDGERGVIVTTASVAAFDGQRGQVSYAASKGAIVAMTLPAARDLGGHGIRVCCIAPGLMDTPLFHTLPPETVAGLTADTVFPDRLGLGEEFALLAEHIVTNRYLNAEVIRLDAGIRMRAA